MEPLITAHQAAEADKAAIAAGTSMSALMREAATGLVQAVVCHAPVRAHVLIACGPGNNGGDGWAAASMLAAEYSVAVVTASDAEDRLGEVARSFRDAAVAAGVPVHHEVTDGLSSRPWAVAIDAMFGTGQTREVDGAYADLVGLLQRVHANGTPIVAADVPTGIDADTGERLGPVVTATETVTFGAAKRGLAAWPGAHAAGAVRVSPLGDNWIVPETDWHSVAREDALRQVAQRDATSNKWRRGHVLVVAGSRWGAGAVTLASGAALRAGVGLVSVVTVDDARSVVHVSNPGAMVHDLPHDENGEFAPDAAHGLPDLDRFTAIGAGPGMGFGKGTRSIVEALLAHDVPLVLDADALNVFRDDPETLATHTGPLVLTPNEKELARLSGLATSAADLHDVETRRIPLALELAERLGAIVVAKGPRTPVVTPEGKVYVIESGGPELGVGGSGDILTGIVTAVVANWNAQPAADRRPLAHVVAAAVWRHGNAGDHLAARRYFNPTPSSLLEALPHADAEVARWLEDHDA